MRTMERWEGVREETPRSVIFRLLPPAINLLTEASHMGWREIIARIVPGTYRLEVEIGPNLRDVYLAEIGGSPINELILQKVTDMADSMQDLRNAYNEQRTALDQELGEIQTKLTELQTMIEAGGTSEERAALIADIQADTERIRNIIQTEPPMPEDPGAGEEDLGDIEEDLDLDEEEPV
jgi:hypothetical protein